jgi:hypothetical protein
MYMSQMTLGVGPILAVLAMVWSTMFPVHEGDKVGLAHQNFFFDCLTTHKVCCSRNQSPILLEQRDLGYSDNEIL